MENKTLNVAEVSLLPDESWVSALEAVVLKVEQKPTKKGGTWWPVTLGDKAGDYTKCCSVGLFAAPSFSEGDKVRLSGQGIMKKSYNGKAQINMGKSARIEVMHVGSERIQAAMNRPAPPAEGVNHGPSIIHGATVGNAVKEVFRALTHGIADADIREDLRSPEFWEQLKAGASQFIRVSQELEAGKLADSPSDQIPY